MITFQGKPQGRAAMRREMQELARKLAEAESTLKAVLEGKVDAVVNASTDSVVLLQDAQDALRESQNRLQMALQASNIGPWDWNLATNEVYYSPEWKRQIGYGENEMTGSFVEFENRLHENDRANVAAALTDFLDNPGAGYDMSFRLRHKNGSYRWINSRAMLILNASGKAVRMLGCHLDITERKHAEEALLQKNNQIQVLFDLLPAMIWIKDTENRILRVNKLAADNAGMSVAEIEGKPTSDIYPADAVRYHLDDLEVIRSGVPKLGIIESIPDRNGRKLYVQTDKVPYFDTDGKCIGIVVAARDITERKHAELRLNLQFATANAINESTTVSAVALRILQSVCENMQWDVALLWLVDQSAEVLRCAEIRQMPLAGIDDFVADSRAVSFAPGAVFPGRIMLGREAVWISDVATEKNFLRAESAKKAGLHAAFAFPVQTGEKLLGVLEMFSREIRNPYYSKSDIEVFVAIGGQIAQFIERKSVEQNLEQAAEQLRQSQKLEGIGQLAGGIAHDFNNLLTVINGRSQLMMSRFKPGDRIRNELELISKTGDRAAALTRQLLAFSRRQVLQPKVLDLNFIVADMDKMLSRMIREDIDLISVLDPTLKKVKADAGQIEQVIVNLVVNARDAMPAGGKLTIETANVELSKEYYQTHTDVRPGAYVMLAVSDNGQGMDTAVKARIFEPFYTTKPQGQGTGLGLSTVYGIVKQSGGHIAVYSEVGKGTTFKIYLPQSADVQSAEFNQTLTAASTGKEVILVSEDEEGVRDLVRDLLEMNGYTVLVARNGKEALNISKEHKGKIHLLLTDVVMPGIGGPELANRVRADHPETKVLFTSGYTDHAIVRNGELEAGLAFIQKPFTPVTLARKVREVLDAERVETQVK